MKSHRIVIASVKFYWKSHIAAGLAVVCAVAVLLGALSSGDSIWATLEHQTRIRQGKTSLAVQSSGLFGAALAERISQQNGIEIAPVLSVKGFAENTDGTSRAGGIQVLGVDERFWGFGPAVQPNLSSVRFAEGVAISRGLARRLNIDTGQEIVVRTAVPGGMAIEAAMTPEEQRLTSFRRKVDAIVEEDQFGAFDLYARPDGGLNVFVPLKTLNQWFEFKQDACLANQLLVGSSLESSEMLKLIQDNWTLSDAGLSLSDSNVPEAVELRHRGVFFPDSLAQSIERKVPSGLGILTYFVNEFRIGTRTTPYSFICAMDADPQAGIFGDLAADEMLINEWLADDLKASEGDRIELRYFVPAKGKSLSEQTAVFRIKAVVPMMGTGADPSLMPDFQAMADAENCRDWKPGIPIDLSRIRPADELYWQKYKGSPKAFIAMKTARLLFASRFGSLTAIRYSTADDNLEALTQKILSAVTPQQVGFGVLNVYEEGQKSAVGTTDFGGLMVSMSFFLIIASLILAGQVYAFSLQRRCSQAGILSAVGLSGLKIFSIFIFEQAMVVLPAIGFGILLGMVLTRLILCGLNTIWADAAGGMEVFFGMRWSTILVSSGISVTLSLSVFAWKFGGLLKRPIVDLLDRGCEVILPKERSFLQSSLAVVLLIIAAVMAIYGNRLSADKSAAVFFGSGAMVLISLSLVASSVLAYTGRKSQNPSRTLLALAMHNAARRKGRSLAVLGMLGIGVFAVFSVGGFQKTAQKDYSEKISSTGGFSIWTQSDIALAQLPDMAKISLPDSRLKTELITAVGLRQYSEEAADCLNLAQTQRPIIWGVIPEMLSGRFRFKSALKDLNVETPWDLLGQDLGADIVPAIGDYATVYWALHKNLGDTIDYVDQSGRLFQLKIVGLLDDSILQGGLIIADKQFVSRFSDTQGWSVILIDAPASDVEAVSRYLMQTLPSNGVEAVNTADRLNRFHRVENTYLSIFMALGSLGLILGTAGLGLVVLLNVLDRAGELAIMRAVGFSKSVLIRMLFIEHVGLLSAGLGIGLTSACVSAGPKLFLAGQFPWRFLIFSAIILVCSGLCWVWLSAKAAIRGDLLEPLRRE